jgi:hypothetical protein
MSTIVENVSADEKWEALDLVFRSQTFSRSDRLKSLLRFLCEAEIEGRSDDLKEYAIGIEVLGKPAEFSPGEDSSVRSRAYELRRKLEKFYATEASDAAVRIEIPKGSYLPHFVRVALPEICSPTKPAEAPLMPTVGTESRRSRLLPLIGAFVAGMAVAAAGMVARNVESSSDRTPRAWAPELEMIWRPMLDSKAPILVSFQNRLFLRVGPLNVRDWKVNSIDAVESSESLMRLKKLFNAPQVYENRNYIDFGAANAVFQLSKLLATKKQNIFAKRSSDVTWDDLTANNVIILGKPEADPTVLRWLSKGEFVESGGVIRNLHPALRELSEWRDDGGGGSENWKEKYALITMLPGPGGKNWVMSMSGSGSEHPWAMADYFTDPENARDLVRHLRLPSGKLPSAYQVVIRAEFKSQTPVKVAYVAHRSLDKP